MTIPTFGEISQRLGPVFSAAADSVHWAGIYGSVAKNRAREGSNVNIVVILQPRSPDYGVRFVKRLIEALVRACGFETYVMIIEPRAIFRPKFLSHYSLEAVLTGRSVYGTYHDVRSERRCSRKLLEDISRKSDLIAEALQRVHRQVSEVGHLELFVSRAGQPLREACVKEARELINLFDFVHGFSIIYSLLYHRTKAIQNSHDLGKLLDKEASESQPMSSPGWQDVWQHLQPISTSMRSFDEACSFMRKYVRHVHASERLSVAFEDSAEITDDMYTDIMNLPHPHPCDYF